MGLKIGIGLGQSKAKGMSMGGALLSYFKMGQPVGNLDIATLIEPSGMTYAPRPENVSYLWSVQDSGAAASLIAVNKASAALAGTWAVTGAANVDWESMTSFRLAGVNYIVAGDIGNNGNGLNTRGAGIDLILYRCVEPVITGGNGNIGGAEIIQCVYPAGNIPAHRDCEAIFADPATGDIYFINKRVTPVPVYRLAYQAAYVGIQTLTYLGTMTADATFNTISTCISGNNGYVTDACISPDGKEILVRSYDSIYYWKRTPSETIFASLQRAYNRELIHEYVGGGGGPNNTVSTNPKFFHPTGEPQGECLTFDQAGRNFYTCSEFATDQADVAGAMRVNPLFRYDRVSQAPTVYTFQQGLNGYVGAKDTFVDSAAPLVSNAAALSVVMDYDYSAFPTINRTRQSFFRWDVSSIPSTKRVIAAYIEFYIGNEGKQFELHEVFDPWADTLLWAESQALLIGNFITQFGTTQGNAIALDVYVGFIRVNLPLTLAQFWVSNLGSNQGIRGSGGSQEQTGDGLQVDSSKSATQARKPKLVIVCTD